MFIGKLFYSIYLYGIVVFFWLVNMPIFFLLWLISRPFDHRNKFTHYITAIWGRMHFLFLFNVKVNLIDKQKLIKKEACIYLTNHNSYFDIAAVFCIYSDLLWVSKKENFQTPILGWVMRMNRYIVIDRKDPKRLQKMMDDCRDALNTGEHIIIFPEGTRSKTGKLNSFKDGAFLVALDNKVPIVPIVMEGTQHVLPKKGFLMSPKRFDISIKVMDPIPYEQFGTNDPKILKDQLFQVMSKELEMLRSGKK